MTEKQGTKVFGPREQLEVDVSGPFLRRLALLRFRRSLEIAAGGKMVPQGVLVRYKGSDIARDGAYLARRES